MLLHISYHLIDATYQVVLQLGRSEAQDLPPLPVEEVGAEVIRLSDGVCAKTRFTFHAQVALATENGEIQSVGQATCVDQIFPLGFDAAPRGFKKALGGLPGQEKSGWLRARTNPLLFLLF